MARDEALLLAAGRGATPTLRLYAWTRPTLSLGAHQSSSDVDLRACRRLGVDLVRRPTGGHAVLHFAELTYSVAGRMGEGVFPFSVVGLYERISEALIAGLGRLGVKGEASQGDGRRVAHGGPPDAEGGSRSRGLRGGEDGQSLRRPSVVSRPSGRRSLRTDSSPDCFARASRREILVSGRKLIGSAQVRRSRAFLQHGSILLDWNPSLLAQVLPSTRRPAPAPEAAAGSSAAVLPITLSEILGKTADVSDVEDAIAHGFRDAFGAPLESGRLDPLEAEQAARLRAFKYLDVLWTMEGKVRPPSSIDGGF